MRLPIPSLPLVAVLFLSAPAIAAERPVCLQACTPSAPGASDCCLTEPSLVAPCAEYKRCRLTAGAEYDDCIAANPACKPSRDGRCTLLVERCAQTCQFARDLAVRRCENDLAGAGSDTCTFASRRVRRFAAKVCRKCTSVSAASTTTSTTSTTTVVTTTITTTTTTTLLGATTTTRTTTTTTTTTASPPIEPPNEANLRACLLRLDSVHDCYSRCNDRCDGYPAAVKLCQQGCRNDFCSIIKHRCATVDGGRITPDVDREYFRSCNARDNCRDRDQSPCEVTTTTESTTTTTTASTSSTASSTTSTTLFGV